MFLLGEFQNRIDPRGRAFVPVKFREQMGSPVYMILDDDEKCIECYNEEGMKARYESALSDNDPIIGVRTVKRGLFSSGDTQPIDNQGRIILKSDYIEKIGAQKDVVFLGAYDHFEIWSKDGYERMKSDVSRIKNEAGDIRELEIELSILEKKTELEKRKKALMAEMGE